MNRPIIQRKKITKAMDRDGTMKGNTASLSESSMRSLDMSMKHCEHCKGVLGPCTCKFGCHIPTRNILNSMCFPVHTGIRCDSCRVTSFKGPRFKCQTCFDFDICQRCYERGGHDATHPFFIIVRVGMAPVLLLPRCISSTITPAPNSFPQFQQGTCSSSRSSLSSLHADTQQQSSGSKSSCSAPQQQLSSQSNSSVSTTPSSCTEGNEPSIAAPSPAASSTGSIPLASAVAVSTLIDDPAIELAVAVPVVSTLSSKTVLGDPRPGFKRSSQGQVTLFNTTPLERPQRISQSRSEQQMAVHKNIMCDGANCIGRTTCIMGPRYTCADCHPSVDLCRSCYVSRKCHNLSHAFKRFDRANNPAYTLCRPQVSAGPLPVGRSFPGAQSTQSVCRSCDNGRQLSYRTANQNQNRQTSIRGPNSSTSIPAAALRNPPVAVAARGSQSLCANPERHSQMLRRTASLNPPKQTARRDGNRGSSAEKPDWRRHVYVPTAKMGSDS